MIQSVVPKLVNFFEGGNNLVMIVILIFQTCSTSSTLLSKIYCEFLLFFCWLNEIKKYLSTYSHLSIKQAYLLSKQGINIQKETDT